MQHTKKKYYALEPHMEKRKIYRSAHSKPRSPRKWNYFSFPQAVPAGQIKSFAIPQQKETIN
jgi:hypothetical protein